MAKPAAKNQKAKPEGNRNSPSKAGRSGNQSATARSSALKASTSRASHSFSQPVCREPACENIVIGCGYCRLHYIKNWQKLKRKEAILHDGRLRQYIEELVSKYTDKYIEAIRHDLMTDDVFVKVITELDLHESEDEMVDMDSSSSIDEYPMDGVRTDIEGRDDEF
jgi:hypothetical protein